MDEDLEKYAKTLLGIAQRAYRSGNATLKANAMGMVHLVESEDLDEAREYWETQLTADQQRVIPPPPGTTE